MVVYKYLYLVCRTNIINYNQLRHKRKTLMQMIKLFAKLHYNKVRSYIRNEINENIKSMQSFSSKLIKTKEAIFMINIAW